MSGRDPRPAQLLASVALAGLCLQSAAASPQRPVVELFTSQGCSSCPPADAIAGRLSTDPAVLVLSFHVNYWDDLGWKDPFSSQASTDRQYAYARSLSETSVFTPQVIVNGTQSVVGSQESAIRKAIAAAGKTPLPIQVDLSKQADGSVNLVLTGPAVAADIWEVRYVHHSVTRIGAGENGGRTLETFNDVTQLRRIGAFASGTFKLQPLQGPQDGLAVVVQSSGMGRILGASAY
jgi:hypothetical protein